MRMTCFQVGYSRIVTEEAVKYLEGVLHSLVDAVCEEVGFRDGLDYNERMEKYKQITYVLQATFDALTAHYGWRRFRGEDEYDAREIMEQTDVYEEFEEYAVLGVRQITYTVMNFARWFAWFIQIRARAVPTKFICRSNVEESLRAILSWLPKKRGWDLVRRAVRRYIPLQTHWKNIVESRYAPGGAVSWRRKNFDDVRGQTLLWRRSWHLVWS